MRSLRIRCRAIELTVTRRARKPSFTVMLISLVLQAPLSIREIATSIVVELCMQRAAWRKYGWMEKIACDWGKRSGRPRVWRCEGC